MSKVTRITATPRVAASGASTTVRLAGGGSAKPHHYDGQHYRAGVVTVPRFRTTLGYGPNGWTGGTVPTTGNLVFRPSTPALLTEFAGYYWKDATVTVEHGPEDGPFVTRLTGIVTDAAIDGGALILTLADLSSAIDKPVLTARFKGDGGIEGGSEAEGRIKRRSWGRVFNIEGRILDKANNIYEFGDPAFPWEQWDALRDKGREASFTGIQWQGSAAATLAALKAAPPVQGGGVVAPSIACAKWWTQPAGPLTADIRGERGTSYVETAPEIAARISAAVGGPGIVNTSAMAAIRAAAAGLHIGDEGETAAQAIDRLLLGVSLLWILEPSGRISLREWSFANPAETLRSSTVSRKQQFAPVKARRVGYQRSHRLHGEGEIAAVLQSADIVYRDQTPIENLRPAETGATRGAPAGTPVGGVPAEAVANAVNAVNSPTTGLVVQTQRIDEILTDVTALEATYGNTASSATSAAVAGAAKLAAENAKTASQGSASAAAGSAETATTKAGEAGVSAAAAQASRVAAEFSARLTLPSDFRQDGQFFSGAAYTGENPPSIPANSAITFATTSEGRAAKLPAEYFLAHRGYIKTAPNRSYRLTVQVLTSAPASNHLYVEILGLDTSFTYTGALSSQDFATTLTGQWATFTIEFQTGAVVPSAQSYLRGYAYNRLGKPLLHVLNLRLEDITESTLAGIQAAVATTKAAAADASAAAAQASQTVSAQFGNQAKWLQQSNRSFDFGLDSWARNADGTGSFPAGVITTSAWEGGNYLYVPAGSGYANVFSKQLFPVDTARKYRFRANIGAYNNGSSGQIGKYYAGFAGYDANGNLLDHGSYGSFRYCVLGPGSQVEWNLTDGQRFERESLVTGEGNDSWLKFPPGTKQIRLMAIMNYTGSGTVNGYLGWLDFEDVTESQAAATSASASQGSAATATAQAAIATSQASLAASIGQGTISRNSVFADWPGASGTIPSGWNDWAGGASNTKDSGIPGGYAYSGAAGAGNQQGLFQNTAGGSVPPGWYVIEADVRLNSGVLTGACVLFRIWNGGGTTYTDHLTHLADEKTTDGTAPGVGTVGKIYRYRRLIQVTKADANYSQFYLMTAYNSFSIATPRSITWFRCGFRPATQTEIRDQTVLAPLEAAVNTQAGALADVAGKTQAYFQREVNAGTASSFFAMRATSNNPAPTPLTLVRSANMAVVGPRGLRKTGGSGWAEGAYSQESYTGSAYASFTVSDASNDLMLGLNSDPASDHSYSSIDYAIEQYDGVALIYESATNMGASIAVKPGDVLSVEYSGTTITYRKNGVVFRSTSTTAGRTFWLDTSFYRDGARADNIVFGPTPPLRESSVSFGASEFHVYNPSGSDWKKALSVVGGDVIIAGKLNVNGGVVSSPDGKTSFDLNANRIVFNNGGHMKVTGVGFGSSNQFIEWFGPTQASLSSCTEANAISYLKTNGAAYFGGTLSAGLLKNAATGTAIASNASVTTGVFGSNGGARIVTLGYSYSTSQQIFDACPANPGGSATIALYRGTSASGTYLTSMTVPLGQWSCSPGFGPGEPGGWNASAGSAITYTDNSGGLSAAYFAQITSRSLPIGSTVSQDLSIISTEG